MTKHIHVCRWLDSTESRCLRLKVHVVAKQFVSA